MSEHTLLCKRCRNIFRLPLPVSSQSRGEFCIRCPKCGSPEISDAPAWAPLGSGSNIFVDSVWEYECQQCHHKFEMPVPKSPTEAKKRTCPVCHSGHLHLATNIGAQPLYCG